jgi:hypothetical protein
MYLFIQEKGMIVKFKFNYVFNSDAKFRASCLAFTKIGSLWPVASDIGGDNYTLPLSLRFRQVILLYLIIQSPAVYPENDCRLLDIPFVFIEHKLDVFLFHFFQ